MEDDGGAHAGEWAFVRGDGVGFCADEAEGVGSAWLGGEVVHFVIEDDAGAWDDDFRAEGGVDGGGGGDDKDGGVGVGDGNSDS